MRIELRVWLPFLPFWYICFYFFTGAFYLNIRIKLTRIEFTRTVYFYLFWRVYFYTIYAYILPI